MQRHFEGEPHRCGQVVQGTRIAEKLLGRQLAGACQTVGKSALSRLPRARQLHGVFHHRFACTPSINYWKQLTRCGESCLTTNGDVTGTAEVDDILPVVLDGGSAGLIRDAQRPPVFMSNEANERHFLGRYPNVLMFVVNNELSHKRDFAAKADKVCTNGTDRGAVGRCDRERE